MDNGSSPTVYRVSKKDEWFLPITTLLFSIIAGYLIMRGDYSLSLCLSVLLIGGLVAAIFTWQTRIELNDEGLYVQKGPRRGIKLSWRNILLAEHIRQGKRINLMRLATVEGVYDIDLSSFDADEIWRQVQETVPPEALGNEAYKELPAYHAWLQEKERLLSHIEKPLTVRYPGSTQVALLVILLTFVIIGVLVFTTLDAVARNPLAWLFFGVLVSGASLGYLSSVTIKLEMNSQEIVSTNLWRRKEMGWEEVKAIENNKRKHRLIFYGEDKSMGVLRPEIWHGENSQSMLNMLNAQIEYRHIQWIED